MSVENVGGYYNKAVAKSGIGCSTNTYEWGQGSTNHKDGRDVTKYTYDTDMNRKSTIALFSFERFPERFTWHFCEIKRCTLAPVVWRGA